MNENISEVKWIQTTEKDEIVYFTVTYSKGKIKLEELGIPLQPTNFIRCW